MPSKTARRNILTICCKAPCWIPHRSKTSCYPSFFISFLPGCLTHRALRRKKRHTTLEDNVTLDAGATILGGDTIVESGLTVAASVFLKDSAPPRSLVFYEERPLQILDKDKRGIHWDDWVI